MKFSEKWLREWVNPSLTTNQLAEQLSMAGLEVDGVDPVAGDFSGVVVGEVVECHQHPDADKLRVTKVNVGEPELLDIVCGAANCRQGLKVMVARVGAVLPGNFKIKKAKLRGQLSMGMLCAEEELGMAESSDGIMELPVDAPIGADIRDYLALDDNTVEVDLTPNRSDCLSVAGLAREVGVLNRMPVTPPQIRAVEPAIEQSLPITLQAEAACPRYIGRVVKGVNVKAQTPLWLVEKLRRAGIRSIDPVVDVTNYVMIELGQPMHAFDLEKISGGINVRFAADGEKLTLLDGREVKLQPSTLIIADNERPLALAGIFGGDDSGVGSETTDILLESAFFAPAAIAGQARSYSLHTDSSHRFERGVDPDLQRTAIERATQLLTEIAGGEPAQVLEAKSEANLPQPAQIHLRRERIEWLLGHAFSDEEVEAILSRLDMKLEPVADGWQVSVPTLRFDISIEQDLIEELARIYGYNNIPNASPQASLIMNDHREADLHLDRLKLTLVERGYQEAITYSFVDPKLQLKIYPEQEALVLPNPISADMSAMRLGLWPGLLDALIYNQNRQQPRVRLFESGLRFVPDAKGELQQETMVAGVITGSVAGDHWTMEQRAVDFFDLKGDIEALLALGADDQRYHFKNEAHPALHPGQSAAIYLNDERIGWMGAVHPQLEQSLGLNERTFVFEVKRSAVTEASVPEAAAVSRFPANRRDIAVVVSETVAAGDVLTAIGQQGGKLLTDVQLFDVYRGKGVAEDSKSLAIAMTLQDNERTLEEQEITQVVDSVVAALQRDFDAALRN